MEIPCNVLVIIVLTFGVYADVSAQSISPFSIEYSYYPKSNVSSKDSIQVSFTELELSTIYPFRNDSTFIFLGGITYRHVFPESNNSFGETNLFLLGVNLIAGYKFSKKSTVIINILPAISTSTKSRSFNPDNFLFQGALFYSRKTSTTFSYRVGIVSTSRFGQPLVIPSLGLNYLGKKVKLDINLPFKIEAMWGYKNRFAYGVNISVNGSQYNFDNRTINGVEVDLAQFSRVRIGPQCDFSIKGPLVLSIQAGIAANRTYYFKTVAANDVDFNLENGPFLAAKLLLRPLTNPALDIE